MRTFVSATPTALIESAKIDGAGEFKTFFSIILPLLKSGMATIGLFLGPWLLERLVQRNAVHELRNKIPAAVHAVRPDAENTGDVPDGKLRKYSAAGYAVQLPETGDGSRSNRSDHSGISICTEILC